MTLRATYLLDIDWNNDGSFPAGSECYADVRRANIDRGFSGPLGRVAMIGQATLVLRNDDQAYSPPLVSDIRPQRAMRLRMSYGGDTETLFQGHIETISPTFGTQREREVVLQCVDAMERLDRFEGPMALLENTTADSVCYNAVHAVYTPASESYQPGINHFPFSSDRWELPTVQVGPGKSGAATALPARAADKIQAACVSDLGRFYIAKDGAPTFQNRHQQPLDETTELTLDDDMIDMAYQMGAASIYNHVSVTCYPRTVGQTLEILGRISQGDAPRVDAGATETFTLYFRDPSNPALHLGGRGVITPVAGTDAIATDDPAGEGTDVSTDISVSGTIYGDKAEISIENTGAVVVYIQTLQIRGYAVRVREPVTVVAQDATSIAAYGRRELVVDAALMASQSHAQNLADHLLDRYKDPQHDIRGVSFYANSSATLMGAARDLELCDRVVLSESQTGLSSEPLFVYGIHHTIEPGRIHRVSLDLEEGYDIGGTAARVDEAHVDGPEVVIY